MESHVTGQPTLGELRQAISAVYFGNPLFTPEEQLQANHQAHECEDVAHLYLWLKQARLEDAERGFQTRMRAAIYAKEQAVCLDKTAQKAEAKALLQCRKLSYYSKMAVVLLTNYDHYPSTQLRFLGDAYRLVLDALGGYEQTRKGWAAIYDN